MADAFGDDLFSVFDDEQATSSKKTNSKTESRVEYVFLFIQRLVFSPVFRFTESYMCLFTEPVSTRVSTQLASMATLLHQVY